MEYTVQEQTVFAVLKTVLWGAERFPLVPGDNVDWQAVYQELSDHALAALAVDAAALVSGMDGQLRRTWMQRSMRSMAFWQKLMKEQAAVRDLFRRKKIPFVVLKGAAAAVYYPQPDRRAMGDVDLIVLPEDFDRARQAMEENGFELLDDRNDRHLEYKKNGIIFELHRYFSIMSDPETARWLDERIFEGVRNAGEKILDGQGVPVLPELENGLVLLVHINQHLESGLGLRQIVDWMMFVDRALDDAWWDREFGACADRLGLKTLAVTVTRMCQLCLGLREDGRNWCAGADENPCHELMRFTLARGNFGRKTEKEGFVVSFVGTLSNPLKTWQILQETGCNTWELLKKHPWLKPFAWIYQLCRFVRRGFLRKNPLRTLWSEIRKTGKQDDMLTRLGVTRRLKNDFEN